MIVVAVANDDGELVNGPAVKGELEGSSPIRAPS
jgi:hypothetical protein